MTIECAKAALDSSLSLREDQPYHVIIDAQINPCSPTELYLCGYHCISWHGQADRRCYDTEPEQKVLQRRDILSWSHRVQRFLRPARMNEEGRHIARRVVLSRLAYTSQVDAHCLPQCLCRQALPSGEAHLSKQATLPLRTYDRVP